MLFESTSINGMVLNNRFVRSATWEGLANEDGSCTSRLIDIMADLAIGQVGLIITGHAYVSPEGQASLRQMGIHRDEFLPDLSEMADAVHREGGKIVLQLAHAGCYGAVKLTGIEPIGPSIPDEKWSFACREMNSEDIRATVEAFRNAALRTKKAGFDGVQIHAAHGYLLSQFLSPFYNKRKDQYGGSIENRARMLLEIIGEIRSVVGEDFPILVKINSDDYLDSGFCLEDMLIVSKMIEEAGVDSIEMSGGTVNEGSRYKFSRTLTLESEEDEVYYREAALKYKKKVNIPLILVGGIRSFPVAEDIVYREVADFISFSRPLIREPHLVRRWKEGDTRPARCISCNACFRPARKGDGLRCVVEECLRKGEALPEE
ncbi:MAG: NADH:flavin oxidoreductase [Synergistales bacterium]|nr:NADH:flavin oxidoreductase [Synergistales bacterium]